MATDINAQGLAITASAQASFNSRANAAGVQFAPARTKRRAWQAMTSPPSITYGATPSQPSTVNASGAYNLPTIPHNSSKLTLVGSGALLQSGSVNYTYYGSNSQQSNALRGGMFVIRFVTNAPKFDFLTRGQGKISLVVNGEIQSLTGIDLTNGGAISSAVSYYNIVDFGSDAVREIELIFSNGSYFGGLNVPVNYDVWPWPVRGPRLMIFGDSYVAEQVVAFPGGGFARQMARTLGYDDVWISGVGGTGYIATASGTAPNFRGRMLTDIVPFAPDEIAIFGGINDTLENAAAVQAEAALFFAAIFAALPNIKVTVFGPWKGSTPFSTTPQAISDAIKAAAQASPRYGTQIKFIDTFALGYQTGLGRTLKFTAPLVAATSATMVNNWLNSSGTRKVLFSDGTTKDVTFTNGSASISWTGAVTATINAQQYISTLSDGGNAMRYLLNDGTHLTQVGDTDLGARAAFDYAQAWGLVL